MTQEGEKQQTKMTEIIIFKVPKSVKEELEQFCKVNGYNISGAVRMAIQQQIISPDLKTQAELWKIILAWTKNVEKWTKEVDAWRKDIMAMFGKMLTILKDVDKHTWENRDKLEILEKAYLKSQPLIIKALKERPTRKQLEKVLTKVFTEYNESLTGILEQILKVMKEK